MMTDSGDFACPEAREESQGQWGNAVPNRYPYLRYMLAEYIKQLCEENHLDLTLLKTKEDRIQALQMLPNLRDAGLNLNTSSREKPVDTFNIKLKGFHVLTSDDDVECYLSTFERLCIKHSVPEANWSIILESFLTGKAQQAYFALTENEKEDYQLVKESVLYAYQLTPNTYREKFRNASKNSSETFRQFSSRLFLYLRRWLNPSDDLLSSKEFVVMMDKLIGDQLISSLKDENLRLKLLEQKWNTLADLADVADNLIVARAACRSKSYDTRPKVSGASTQLNGNVRAPQSNIGSQVAQEPVTSGQRRSASRSDVTSLRCYRCNQVGHVSYNCPNNPQEDVINFVTILDPTHQEELHAVVDMINPKEENPQYNHKPKGAYFETLIDGEASLAYVDSGADVSLISTSLVRTRVVKALEQPICLSLLDGTPFVVAGKITCTLEVAGERDQVEFFVSDIPCDILMGRDLLVKFALVFDLRNGSYWSEGPQTKVKFPLVWVGAKDGTCGKKDSLKKDEKVGEEPDPLEDYGNDDQDSEHDFMMGKIGGFDDQIDKLLSEYKDVFCNKPGYCNLLQHRIDTGDAAPIRKSPYKVSPKKRVSLESQITEMLEWGVIVPSSSEWCSPIVMVPKKDGTYRLAVDYRGLNAVTKPSNYPIPTIDGILYSLNGSKVFSTLDLKSGFWQAALRPEDQCKTAFACEEGVFEFKTLPFGLRNASQNFQNLVDVVLKPLKQNDTRQYFYPYIDDIVIHSTDVQTHFQDLKNVLGCLQKAGLTVNPSKCHFLYSKVKFLGYVVSKEGIELNPEKCEAVSNFPRPVDKKALERFLGLSGWCAKFVKGYSQIVEPLNELRRKDVEWRWSEACEKAFVTLKQEISSVVSLTLPNFQLPFEVHTDASVKGLGAALMQTDTNGESRVIAFGSRSLKGAEKNYSATELECLAVLWAFEKWRPFIEGSQITVFTDHKALVWMLRNKALKGKLVRWALRLQEFDYTVHYRPGIQNMIPDALSRAPQICSID